MLVAATALARTADALARAGWEELSRNSGALNAGSREARQSFEAALKQDKKHADALWGLGIFWLRNAQVHIGIGTEFREAAKVFQQLISAHPQDPRGYRGLAWTHYAQGNSRGAVKAFGQLLKLVPEDAEATRGLAWLQIRLERYAEAEANFERALRNTRPDADAWLGRAVARFGLNQGDAARADVRQAFMAGRLGEGPGPFVRFGLPPSADGPITFYLRSAVDQFAGAMRTKASVVGADPNVVLLAAAMEYCRASGGGIWSASQLVERALKLWPDDEALLFAHAFLATKGGAFAEGESRVMALLRKAARDAELHSLWAELAFKQKDYRGATEAIREARQIAPDETRYRELEREIEWAVGEKARIAQAKAKSAVQLKELVVGTAVVVGTTVAVAALIEAGNGGKNSGASAPQQKYFGEDRCFTCSGSGARLAMVSQTRSCGSCGGSGGNYDWSSKRRMLCGGCGGSGARTENISTVQNCLSCGGSGRTK